MRAMFHTSRAPLRLYYPCLFLWHGWPLEAHGNRKDRPAARCARARSGLRHGRFLAPGAQPVSRNRGRSPPISPSACCNWHERADSTTPCAATPAACPSPMASFDAVFVGYGLRNFPNLKGAVEEIRRVTRPGGLLVSLDFFLPANPCCATVTLLISTPRAHSGALCCTAGRAFTLIFPIRCGHLFPSANSRRCCRHAGTTAIQRAKLHSGRNRAALGSQTVIDDVPPGRPARKTRSQRLPLYRHLPPAARRVQLGTPAATFTAPSPKPPSISA